MAKEVTAWCRERRQKQEEARKQKIPETTHRDLMFHVQKGGVALVGPESPEGEEWLAKNVDGERVARSWQIASRSIPEVVEAAEKAGLEVRERFSSVAHA